MAGLIESANTFPIGAAMVGGFWMVREIWSGRAGAQWAKTARYRLGTKWRAHALKEKQRRDLTKWAKREAEARESDQEETAEVLAMLLVSACAEAAQSVLRIDELGGKLDFDEGTYYSCRAGIAFGWFIASKGNSWKEEREWYEECGKVVGLSQVNVDALTGMVLNHGEKGLMRAMRSDEW